MKNVYIITGGTTVPIAPHLELSSKAYGKVGRELYDHIAPMLSFEDYRIKLIETAMCNPEARNNPYLKGLGFEKGIETVDDLSKYVDILIADPDTRCIVMSAAICDFKPIQMTHVMKKDGVVEFFNKHMYETDGENKVRPHKVGGIDLKIAPSEKIIQKIRKERKDIFLVSFKTTSDEAKEELFKRSLANLKGSSSNIVFGNDIKNHYNMIVTPEEFPYHYETRSEALEGLAKMVSERL